MAAQQVRQLSGDQETLLLNLLFSGQLGWVAEGTHWRSALNRAMAGLVDWYSVWRADGQGYVLTVFKDKASADASLGLARDIWGGLSKLLKGQPKPETFDNVEALTK